MVRCDQLFLGSRSKTSPHGFYEMKTAINCLHYFIIKKVFSVKPDLVPMRNAFVQCLVVMLQSPTF